MDQPLHLAFFIAKDGEFDKIITYQDSADHSFFECSLPFVVMNHNLVRQFVIAGSSLNKFPLKVENPCLANFVDNLKNQNIINPKLFGRNA